MKTTVDVDRERAREAAEVLGTTTLKETVNAALVEVVKAARRRELADRVRNGTLPVPTPEELAEWRAPKLPVGALDGVFDDVRRP
jgi:Arc/MetJ family transcription regulator